MWLFFGYFILLIIGKLPKLINYYKIDKIKNTQGSTFCKAFDLPNSEIDRGQEHVKKVETGYVANYNFLQAKVIMDKCSYFRNETETIASHNRCIFTLYKSSQSLYKCVVNNQLNESLEIQPKITKTVKRTTIGFPKWGNPYGDGVSIVGFRKLSKLNTKVRQEFKTYSTNATNTQISEYNSGMEWISQLKKCDDERYTGLYKLICGKELLSIAYSEIK